MRDVLSRWEASELSQLEAAEVLGMSERTFRRWARRLEAEGEDGLIDRRLGRRSGRAVPDADRDEVERLYRERYSGFTARHFHEHLVRDHGFRWGYTPDQVRGRLWTKTYLQGRGLLARAPRRGAHRRKRPRRPPCSLYTDRGSHYFHTPEAGGKVAKDVFTQVGRALRQLGVEHIAAYSPEARGRSERMFRTLQDRLPKELVLAEISDDVAAANRFLAEVYLPAHNARFAVAPAEAGSAFVPVAEAQWRDVLSVQEERTVAADNTVAWNGRRLQIPPHPARHHFVRAKVRVHEYPDGALAIFHGPRCLVRWRPEAMAAPLEAAA